MRDENIHANGYQMLWFVHFTFQCFIYMYRTNDHNAVWGWAGGGGEPSKKARSKERKKQNKMKWQNHHGFTASQIASISVGGALQKSQIRIKRRWNDKITHGFTASQIACTSGGQMVEKTIAAWVAKDIMSYSLVAIYNMMSIYTWSKEWEHRTGISHGTN